jgi:hypothetical protein
LDNTIVKRMVQMGYNSKEVQNIVRNNQTSPILTTYHSIRNLSIEKVPNLNLLPDPFALAPLQSEPTTSPPQPTTSPPLTTSTSEASTPSKAMDINERRSRVSITCADVPPEMESPHLDLATTPPLLALVRDLPPEPASEDLQFPGSPTLLIPIKGFGEYRSRPDESDFSLIPSSPPLTTSCSLPAKTITPPPSPVMMAACDDTRQRGASDPPLAHDLIVPSPSPPPSPLLDPFPSPPSTREVRSLSVGDTWPKLDERSSPPKQWSILDTLEDECILSSSLSLSLILSPFLKEWFLMSVAPGRRTLSGDNTLRSSVSSPIISTHTTAVTVPTSPSMQAQEPPLHASSAPPLRSGNKLIKLFIAKIKSRVGVDR